MLSHQRPPLRIRAGYGFRVLVVLLLVTLPTSCRGFSEQKYGGAPFKAHTTNSARVPWYGR